MSGLRVALVSRKDVPCGIAEHSAQLMAAVTRADPTVQFRLESAWLDPNELENVPKDQYDLVHLDYHRGLHSRWTPAWIHTFGKPFVITFHDTYQYQGDLLPWDLLACSNVRRMVVHEMCDLHEDHDVRVGGLGAPFSHHLEHRHKVRVHHQPCPVATGRGWPVYPPAVFQGGWGGWRPTLGTLGFDFPWKNYDLLAEVTGRIGWNLRVVGEVPEPRRLELLQLNPRVYFDGYADAENATLPNPVQLLSSCDATAFMYSCANSGTSGAIRVGMTAGKPLVATDGCRQFRDLQGEGSGIIWAEPTVEGLTAALLRPINAQLHSGPGGYDLRLMAWAHQHDWDVYGWQYLQLYKEAVAGA